MKRLSVVAFLLMAFTSLAVPIHTNYVSLNVSTSNPVSYGDFRMRWVNQDNQYISLNIGGAQIATNDQLYLRLAYPRRGMVYLEVSSWIYLSSTSLVAVFSPTNIPPPKAYYSEFMVRSASGSDQRIIGAGIVETEWSIFGNTNTAAWTNGVTLGDGYPSNLYVQVVESDPVFTSSVAAAITSAHTSRWEQSYAWGDHSTNGYTTAAGTTDLVARAAAAAASNEAAAANANQAVASNSLASRVTAAAQAATNAHLLALAASNTAAAALAGLPSLVALSNGVTAAALAATNADAKAAQAQVLGTNAAALAALAITNLQESGSGNAITGSAVVGRSGVLYRGTVAGGSGSETQGFASVQSLGNSAPTVNLQSAYVVIGGNAQFYRHPVYDNGDFSVLVIGGGGADSEGGGRTNNVVSNALDSVILGGNGNRISGPPSGSSGYSVYQQIFGSHASDIGWTDTNIVTKYNSIGGGNNHHVWDSSFATVFGGGGTFIYNSDSVGSLSASHHFFTNCTQVLGLGGVIAMSNRAGVLAYASDWHNDTNALVPNRDNAAHFGVEWIQQTTASGTYDLFSNGWMVASILSTNNQYNNTNAIPRTFGWVGGQRNRFLPGLFQPGGTNVYGLVGGGGYSNLWLMATAQGATLWGGMSNSSLSDISGAASVGGFNNFLNGSIGSIMGGGRGNTLSGNYSAMLAGQGGAMAGSCSVMGGRENVGAANYTTTFGYQNQVQSGAQVSTIAGGSTNVIAGAMYAFIGAGTRNIIGSGGTYSFIGAGTTNQALGQGQFVGGNSAVGGANATNSFVWNAAQSGYTNSTPRSAAFNVPGGFTARGPEYGGNAGRGVLTGGVCVINLPFAMSDAAYSIHLTYATDAALLTPLSATGTTSAIYILGSGNNPFHWQVKGVAP